MNEDVFPEFRGGGNSGELSGLLTQGAMSSAKERWREEILVYEIYGWKGA